MRFVLFFLSPIILITLAWTGAGAQETPPPKPADKFFSGIITALTETQITVNQRVLGKDSETRTFGITRETKVEGKPRVKARVTVRFVAEESGDRAVHIIVRSSQKKQP